MANQVNVCVGVGGCGWVGGCTPWCYHFGCVLYIIVGRPQSGLVSSEQTTDKTYIADGCHIWRGRVHSPEH